MNSILDLPTQMVHGEIRLHVDLNLLDEPTEDVLKVLTEMGYSPKLCRYTWQSKEDPSQTLTVTCALLFHCSLPNSEPIFEALNPQWEALEARFKYAVTLVWAGGKMGHNLIPQTKRYEAIAA
jgi:hypothetical protein